MLAAVVTFRATRFRGIPPIDEIVDRETEGRIDIKDEDNAFTYYELAWSQLPTTLDDEAISDAVDLLDTGGDWSDVAPAAKSALDSCEMLLVEWKRGTDCDHGVRVQPADAEWYDMVGTRDSRAISRLAILKSAKFLDEGCADKAWEWLRALFRFSRHLGNPGSMIDRVVGSAFYAMGSKSLVRWAADDRVTVSQIRDAIQELNAIYQMTAPCSLVLKHEYLALSRVLAQPTALQETQAFKVAVSDELEALAGIYLFLAGEPELAEVLLRHKFANCLSQCDRCRWDRNLAATRDCLFEPTGAEQPSLMNVNSLDLVLVRSVLARRLGPSLRHYLDLTDREQVLQTALELCLTAEMFCRQRGRYPETLEELVPEFIEQIPRDLYGATPDERMLMARQNAEDSESDSERKDFYSGPGLVIYSRGGNGIDDGGELRRADIGLKIPIEPCQN